MDLVQEAHESWVRSAEGWIAMQSRGDNDRIHLLDEPMLRLAGDVSGRRVLDVGCGEGRFCRMMTERGAMVTGLDPTPALLGRACEQHPGGSYIDGRAEDMPFTHDSFDLVVAYLTLIDIPQLETAINEMARVLRPKGRLVVANLQSFATTQPEEWQINDVGEKTHISVDNYFEERAQRCSWGGVSVLNWHRPLETYIQAFLTNGFLLRAFEEPRPSPETVARVPEMADARRVPIFYVAAWEHAGESC